ncbi:MAG: polyribonucleotide nucleotidyltransferase [Candidatus Colwellbacteria bacterium]|nr:polyribonucleotide nucleotidyltransferase [Candidatus Colwellbacteria bacterium]
MDLKRKKFTKKIADQDLTLEISPLAERTNAAVLATYGETSVLVTAVMEPKDREINYLPLAVDYEEKFYAAGKILGSRFIRREGRPSDEAILSGRVIDRTIRPLFDHRIRRPLQIVVTVLSYDEENDPVFPALIAASTALGISDIPWNGPVAGVGAAKVGDQIILNARNSDLRNGGLEFDAFIAGTDSAINMIELAGDSAQEANVVEAAGKALASINELVSWQNEIIREIGQPKAELKLKEPKAELVEAVKSFLRDKLEAAVYVKGDGHYSEALNKVKADLIDHLQSLNLGNEDLEDADSLFEDELEELVSRNVLDSGRRPDGRKPNEVRLLHSEVALFPRVHGSALFIRGNTQALAMSTLGAPGAEQLIETMELSGKKRFLLHYNFPPYSVGEARSFRGPGRRDIGHGALAEKAILPLIPTADKFPYTVRVVSEILSSNGSSSMATVSAVSLSLMDAGVPIREPAAGIAIGLITAADGRYKLLTDIQGPEDHHGDMDLKAAGTKNGINAIQMDVKINGITLEILKGALDEAKSARLHILDHMGQVLPKPRAELSKYAPKIITFSIDPTRIGEVIGPGGKIINGIIARTGIKSIDIDDNGQVFVSGHDMELVNQAVSEIKAIVKEFEVGEIVKGKVFKVFDFGALVDIGGGKSGLIHVSELKNEFVKEVTDVVKIGDSVTAKVIKIENGRVDLSLKRMESTQS